MTLVLLAFPQILYAQQAPDRRVADLVRAGRVRIALFSGQYAKDTVTGELKGVWVDVARAFAARVGVQLLLVEHPTPPNMVECLKAGACDIGFLGYDPARAADVEGFTPPFIEFDYTYLVPSGSSIRSTAAADRLGVRLAVVQAHASTLTLTRVRKHAELVSVDTPDMAFELLRTGRVDAWASARPVLVDYSAQLPGSRVLEGRYGVNRAAVVVAKGESARLAYISEFIEDIKASGFVQQAITRSGWRGVRVAPPQAPTRGRERQQSRFSPTKPFASSAKGNLVPPNTPNEVVVKRTSFASASDDMSLPKSVHLRPSQRRLCIVSTVHRVAVTHSSELSSSDVLPTRRLTSQSSARRFARQLGRGACQTRPLGSLRSR